MKNRLVTLQGYNNPQTKKIEKPDETPVYYDDHTVGSLLSAALKSRGLLPQLKIAAPLIKVPPPKVLPPKIIPPTIKIKAPVVKVAPPKIEAKIPPPNQWKVDPKDVRTVGQIGQVAGAVVTGVGGVLSATGIGAALGAPLMAAGTQISAAGTTAIQVAEKIEQANQLKQAAAAKNLSGVLSATGGLVSGVPGTGKVTDIISKASSVSDQAKNIESLVKNRDVLGGVSATQALLNQSGVSPSITSKLDLIPEGLNTANNFLNVGLSTSDKLLNLAKPGETLLANFGVKINPPLPAKTEDLLKTPRSPGDIKNSPPSVFDVLFPNKDQKKTEPTTTLPDFPFLKDPSKDPNSPFYIPPAPLEPKPDPNKKPQKLPSTGEKKESGGNIGIFLMAGIGLLFLTQKKSKK